MAKTLSRNATTSSPNQAKKQRKKQAKREAKTMLKLEQIKQDVQKAEQKVAKAQAQLEARRTRLRELEAEVNEVRSPQSHADTGKDSSQAGSGNHATISTPTNQVASLPPAEGQADFSQDQDSADQVNLQLTSLPPTEGRVDISQDQGGAAEEAEPHTDEEEADHSTHRSTRRHRSQSHATETEEGA